MPRQLRRSGFAGLGGALGLVAMVVFVIMVARFRSLRLPCVMPFTIPVALARGASAPFAAGQGLLSAVGAYPG